MDNYASNLERTSAYLEKFNREKTLKHLIGKSAPVILDVGANVGQSLDEFKKWWPASRVFCFEPQEECLEALRVVAGQFSDKDVTIVSNAVGNESGKELKFYSHDVSKGISGFNKVNFDSDDSIQIKNMDGDEKKLVEYKKQFNHERLVTTIRLDEYLRKESVHHVDLMKIDTQGFEPQVLEGMGEELLMVDVVLTELMFYDYYERSLSFSDIEKYLLPANFSLYDINHISKNPMNGRTDWVDVIYVNNRLRKK